MEETAEYDYLCNGWPTALKHLDDTVWDVFAEYEISFAIEV